MPLHPGTTLGPYSVTAKIGEGAMGEAYQATGYLSQVIIFTYRGGRRSWRHR